MEATSEETGMSLGEAADAGLTNLGEQDALDGMESATKIKFVGMSYDTLDDAPTIGSEVVFLVRGRVVGHGQEEMADGHVRETAKVKVLSVIPHGE